MKLTYDSEVQFDARQIIRLRGLDGEAQKQLVHAVARMCDAYVPLRSGPLKNTVQELPDGLLYNTPYAHYQYVGILMVGEAPKQYTDTPLTYYEAPLRGAEWDKRMWADRGDESVDGIAARVGGKRE